MYKRAVVPLDGSPVAETVIPFILEFARPLDMEVVLLRVVQPQPPVVIEASRVLDVEDVDARRQEALDYLAPVAAELRDKGARVVTLVRRGLPDEEILGAAKDTRADLVAMSTHGRSGFGRLLFGSVAEAVLRHADVPVFLLRATEQQVAHASAIAAVR